MIEIFLLYGDDVSKTTIEIFDKLFVHFLGKINFLEMHFKILLFLCYDSWKSIVYFSFIISKYIIYQNIILFFLTQNSLFNYSITIESSNKLFNLVLFKHFCNTIFHSLTFRNSPFDAHLKCHLCINWN